MQNSIEGLNTRVYDRLEKKRIERLVKEVFKKDQEKPQYVFHVWGTVEQMEEFWKDMDDRIRKLIKEKYDL